MQSTGTFNVTLKPQTDEIAPVGRMIIHKEYLGDIKGVGNGQMISKRTLNASAAYSAIEEFIGEIDGKKGSFTLIHQGLMSAESQQLQVNILKGSGTEDLTGIEGELTITQEADQHFYILTYTLP